MFPHLTSGVAKMSQSKGPSRTVENKGSDSQTLPSLTPTVYKPDESIFNCSEHYLTVFLYTSNVISYEISQQINILGNAS